MKVMDSEDSPSIDAAGNVIRKANCENPRREPDRDQERSILASKLIEGLNSGSPIPFTDDYLAGKAKALRERVRASDVNP